MFKKILNALLEHPILASLFICDFGVLLFLRPPFFFSFLMLGALMAMCLYFGQKLSLFKV